MATQLTIQVPAADLLSFTPTANAADATGNYVVPSAAGVSKLVLRVANTGGASVTVTFDDPTSSVVKPRGAVQFDPDVAVAVTNAQQRVIVISDVNRFVDPATGRINWTYSPALTGSVEVVGVP